ncbi:DASH family cryptochrome [Marinimicrobium sp. LS-A18]|uniref:DASH family cryptochrome n=1 Tax=Marinimicrobium sp. LS-A18 TaxID=1381596 RepID=UPI0004657710|nr:DASH family cryptochrome [Marinimicrobium sp. LS-A18]
MRRVGLYWFGDDLRVSDQPGLARAAAEVDQLICLYVVDSAWFRPGSLALTRPLGIHRERFLLEALRALDTSLRSLGQHLNVIWARPLDIVPALISRYSITHLYRSDHPGYYERRDWQWLRDHYPQLSFVDIQNQTLFNAEQLGFHLTELPTTFSQFRRRVEQRPIPEARGFLSALPPSPAEGRKIPVPPERNGCRFRGGEDAARMHRIRYFDSDAPAHYKHTRNALDDWASSTKFSPWLARGCQSPRQVNTALVNYERHYGANESTEWIRFELLWREYFQWMARAYGADLYRFGGRPRRSLNTSFYPERFRKWCEGTTPYPLVNAAMNQLNRTGYLSNRARQIVASALVNELQVDWRYGAAWFEQQLIDYEVGSNWGNWQYIAGVGADPRGGRHFNLEKQAAQFDPDGDYVRRWGDDRELTPLDSVDAADWPIARS